VDWDNGLVPLNQRTIIAMQQIIIPTDSQNGNAPPPGPSSGIQPMGSSMLFIAW
jgi:hypothetical protein